MKNVLTLWFSFLLVLAVMVTIPVGCRTKQLPPDTQINNSSTDSKLNVTDKTDNNKAIIDSLNLLIGKIRTQKPECDSVCQIEIDRVLGMLNAAKQSGDNGYQIKYDALKKQLDLVMKIAATKNTEKTIIRETDKKNDSQGVKYVSVKYIPDFYRYSAYWGWAAAAFIGFRVVQKIGSIWPRVKLLP